MRLAAALGAELAAGGGGGGGGGVGPGAGVRSRACWRRLAERRRPRHPGGLSADRGGVWVGGAGRRRALEGSAAWGAGASWPPTNAARCAWACARRCGACARGRAAPTRWCERRTGGWPWRTASCASAPRAWWARCWATARGERDQRRWRRCSLTSRASSRRIAHRAARRRALGRAPPPVFGAAGAPARRSPPTCTPATADLHGWRPRASKGTPRRGAALSDAILTLRKTPTAPPRQSSSASVKPSRAAPSPTETPPPAPGTGRAESRRMK